MAFSLYFRPSFKRSLKHLGFKEKKIVGNILDVLFVYYETGCNILKAKEIAAGFFYKQLRKPYYEAGVERNVRVIIRKEGQKCIAVLAGNHDQVKQFLVHDL